MRAFDLLLLFSLALMFAGFLLGWIVATNSAARRNEELIRRPPSWRGRERCDRPCHQPHRQDAA